MDLILAHILKKMKINIKKLSTAYSIGKAKATKYLLELNRKKKFSCYNIALIPYIWT